MTTNATKKLTLGMVVFPHLTMLDFIGPYDVFIKAPCFDVVVVSANTLPIQAEGGLCFQATVAFQNCPSLDILFVPGGRGINALLTSADYINFLKQQGAHAAYITSVCTGSLLLAAAGLLTGYKATTHWRSLDLLRLLSIETIAERVVVDRNRITGAGVTSGVDFALLLTSLIGGETMAKTVQLMLEYNPQPPFTGGSPQTAEIEIVKKAIETTTALYDERISIIKDILTTKS